MSELDSYLDSLSTAGEKQGAEGHFTIDPFKSQKKLQVFRMARPEYCLLPIIAGAVLGGATVIDVRQDSDGHFSVTFDGRWWTYQDFPELLSSKEPITREFQLGLSAAQAMQPRRVVFRSLYGGLESQLTVLDGNPSSGHRSVEDTGKDFNEVRIEGARVAPQTSIYNLLMERCSYCPRVAWMGRRLIRNSPPETAGRLHLDDPSFSQPSIVLSAWTSATAEEAGCSGHLWTSEEPFNKFNFVINGITYPKTVQFGFYQGFCGVITAPGLQLDISRESVVEDQAFRDLMDHLKRIVNTKLMPKIKRQFRLMMPLQRDVARRFLGQWQQEQSGAGSPPLNPLRAKP
ncbi:MAG: hypothetical protein KC800_09680 [Candidatus Eremiobacteraeota bacterium]|nr:hypothetical protein [Candidatus Eremiobacteraeota bacterium]